MTEETGEQPFSQADAMNSVILPLIKSSSPDNPIDVDAIRKLSMKGLDSHPPFDRMYSWLIMLKLFPQYEAKWPEVLRELKTQYFDYVSYTNLQEWHKTQISPSMTIDDFGDNHDMGIIHGDIVRTGRLFFFLPSRPILSPQTAADQGDVLFEFQEHLRRLERILFIFQTFHKGLGYMQGFNELAIPFYYVNLQPYRVSSNATSMTSASAANSSTLSSGDSGDDSISDDILDLVEALTFHCFQKIMTDTSLPELYTTQDESSIIMHQLKTFENLMKNHLPECFDAIQSLQIHPIFYCLRWFTLLFAQEHDFPSLLVVWDALIAHFQTFVEYLFYVGLGHIKMVEGRLNKKLYSATIEALQHLKVSGKVKDILEFANECWEKDKKGK